MLKSKVSKINTNWLFFGWVLLLATLILLLSFNLNDKTLVEINNKNPAWCGRYEYYLNISHNTTVQCLSECWRLFGCEANATGFIRSNNCYCNGIKIRSTAWVVQEKEWWLNYGNETRN